MSGIELFTNDNFLDTQGPPASPADEKGGALQPPLIPPARKPTTDFHSSITNRQQTKSGPQQPVLMARANHHTRKEGPLVFKPP